MTEYQPGTVAIATVRGVEGVRVMSMGGVMSPWWATPSLKTPTALHSELTDIRPLVVLDLDLIRVPAILDILRNVSGAPSALLLADQIEAQTKPARIPEPGLWGVVRDDMGYTWVHDSDVEWTKIGTREQAEWSEIGHPVLIREGLS